MIETIFSSSTNQTRDCQKSRKHLNGGSKKFFMLKSTQLSMRFLNENKYKTYQENQLFSGSDKLIMHFFQLINVKMPTIVGILTFMSRKNFMLS